MPLLDSSHSDNTAINNTNNPICPVDLSGTAMVNNSFPRTQQALLIPMSTGTGRSWITAPAWHWQILWGWKFLFCRHFTYNYASGFPMESLHIKYFCASPGLSVSCPVMALHHQNIYRRKFSAVSGLSCLIRPEPLYSISWWIPQERGKRNNLHKMNPNASFLCYSCIIPAQIKNKGCKDKFHCFIHE